MPLEESNLKLISAVINWLSLFPNSTITSNIFNEIWKPDVVVEILQIILDSSFEVNLDDGLDTVEQYELIFNNVKQYYKQHMISRKKFYKYLDLLKFEELSKGDLLSLNCLCFIFLEIGFHCYKSSVAISIISLLNESDEEELKKFIYDEDDLNCKNLILNQKVNLLELENGKLLQKISSRDKELIELQKNMYLKNQNDVNLNLEFNNGLKIKDDEVLNLKRQLSVLQTKNECLTKENELLNNDLEILRNLKGMLSSSDLNPNYHTIQPKLIESNDDYELLRWEYSLLMEWMSVIQKEKFKRQEKSLEI